VLGYIGFRSLLSEDRSAEEYLADIRSGGTQPAWPAAYDLSRLMCDPEFVKKGEATLAPELTKAFARQATTIRGSGSTSRWRWDG
jgi:hypothetical protein